ncbi:nucleotidyltransferase domain-containing protein [Thermococcus barophilus]|uniref:Polymerase nucleotidyl transferase domain-containing protein n=2 Tax=Thermococcus barophilus TaxID=55802 RepID=A0A0S1XBL3_THEBA|nr:nucleotidyltransferase domain-containing protein [Thermococcus barophilus]ADT84023.1 hypothetical protein TERMP_01047 [Thermococcus barophilus MP]ALM75170.1 hypothetical protein TBCH5v1_1246 [Thermococcus barophilus]
MLEEVKRIILEESSKLGITVENVILFGSRARGNYRKDSDWDILIIVKEPLSRTEYRELWRRIYEKVELPADILIVSKKDFEKLKGLKGYVYYYASKEGVKI